MTQGTPTTQAASSSADAAPDQETSNGQHNGEQGSPQGEQAAPKRTKSKSGNARKTRTVQLTLTVTGTADGDWQAELKHGSTWVARGLEVPAAAVSRAAKELHSELSAPIDEVIDAAREQQQARVAALEAELEEAKQTLANLDKN